MTPLRRNGRRLVLSASALALAAAACSSGSSTTSSDASVRPFADVQDSEMAFEIDPDASGGNTRAVEVRVFRPPPQPVMVTTDSVRPR